MLIASNLFYKQQLLLHLTASSYFLQTVRIELTIVSSILAVYRKLYLAFLTHITRLTILRRPPQKVLRLYEDILTDANF